MRRPLLFACVLVCLAVTLDASLAGGEEERLHPADLALLEQVASVLPPGLSAVAFEEELAAHLDEARSIGFGAELRCYRDGGERVGVWTRVLAVDQRIVAVHVRATGIPAGTLRTQAVARWGEGGTPTAHGLDYRHVHEAELTAYRRAVAAELGTPHSAQIQPKDGPIVALLTDPLAELTFGAACYEAGTPPRGREETDALRLRAATPALDHVLRGLNPEGRVYAAQALRVLEHEGVRLPEEIEVAIARVLALDVPIEACAGCEVFHDRARNLVNDAYLVGAVACALLERTFEDDRWVDVGKVIVYWDGTWVWRRRPSGAEETARARRGRLPADVHDALFHTLQSGEGLPVRLGTPTYVLHLDDPKSTPPPGIAKLHAHLLGTLPQGDE